MINQLKKWMVGSVSLVLLSVVLHSPAYSQSTSDELNVCVSQSVNEKDENLLVKWITLGFLGHPALNDIAVGIDPKMLDESNKKLGQVVTRLLSEDCKNEYKKLHKEIGTAAFVFAFQKFAEIAVVNAGSHPGVTKRLEGLAGQIDNSVITGTF